MADYWIKWFHEILDDPKMATLPDRLWRRFSELCLLTGRLFPDKSGRLPDVRQIAWALRMNTDEVQLDMDQLAGVDLVEPIPGGWLVVNFEKRQRAATATERVQQFRKRAQMAQYNEDETDRKRKVTQSRAEQRTETDIEHTNTSSVSLQDTGGGQNEEKSGEKVPDKKAPDPAIAEMLAAWKTLFPDKPQPKAATYARQIAARMKNPAFRESWRAAMEKASLSPACQAESWFCFEFVVRNDQNFQRMLDGFMDWKDREQYGAVKGNGQAARLSKSDLAAAALGIERRKDGNSNGHGQ